MEIARDKNNNHMQAVVIDTAYNVEQGQTLKLGEDFTDLQLMKILPSICRLKTLITKDQS